MKEIKRTVKFFLIEAEKIKYVDGVLTVENLPTLESTKKLSKASIEKHFKSFIEKGESLMIKETIEKEKTYSMNLQKFITNAEEIQEENLQEIETQEKVS